MKRVSLFAVSLSVACSSMSAHAQSSVTLYGLIDTGMTYIHNSGGNSTQIKMSNGNESGTRWGMTGTEDLGGGLKTIFTLEAGFSPTTGEIQQGGRFFGRQAFVGLTGNRWGTVTVGRQYDATTDLVLPVQGDNFLGGVFTSPGDVDNADASARFNNSIKYASPVWAGLQAEAMYAVGGVAGASGSGQSYIGALAYTVNHLSLALGYTHIDNGNAILSTRGTTTSDTLFNSAVNSAYASASSINIARAGAAYVAGPVTFGGYYSFSKYQSDSSSTFATPEKYNNGSIYANWQISAPLSAEIGYTYMKSSGDSSAKYNQFAVAADYFLSKRTDFYAWAAYTHATGQNGAGSAQAVIGSTDIDSGKSSQANLTVGIRHRF